MTLDIIRKANNAMIKKKTVSSYDLPDTLKRKIMARHYSTAEINEAYSKVNRSRQIGMNKEFESIQRGLLEAVNYQQGNAKGARVHQLESNEVKVVDADDDNVVNQKPCSEVSAFISITQKIITYLGNETYTEQ